MIDDPKDVFKGLAQRLMRPWVWKSAVSVYTLYIFLLIAVYIFIAGRSVTYSYTISGQPQVQSGNPAALRVGVYDIHRARFLPSSDIRIAFVRGQEVREVFKGLTSRAGLGDVNLTVPEVEPGPASWRVTLDPIDMDPETVDIPIEVLAATAPDPTEPWTEAAVVVSSLKPGQKKAAAPDEGTGPVRIDLQAEGNVPVDALRSVIFIQTTERDTGKPVSAIVELEKKKGMIQGEVPRKVRTNKGGLGAFRLIPVGSQEWHLKTTTKGPEGEPVVSERTVTLKSEPTQYAMILRDPIWSADERLEVGVRTLHSSGALYGDLYLGDLWARGEVTGIGQRGGGFDLAETVIPRPKEGIWLARLQVYGDALQPGAAADLRYIVLPAPGVTQEAILKTLLARAAEAGVQKKVAEALSASTWMATASSDEINAQIAFWLSKLSKDLRQPVLLKDTQQGERDTLSDEKESARRQVTWLLAVSGGLGLIIILFLVTQNFVRVRRESRVMMDALKADGEIEVLEPEDFGLNTAIFQLVLLFATIAVFFAALVILLQFL